MLAGELIKFSLAAITSHGQRSVLTIIGIAVGVATVVLLTSLGAGVRNFVLSEFTQFGTNIIAITPGKTETFGFSGASISSTRDLTVADAEALSAVPGVTGVVPVIQGNARVERGTRQRRTTVIGASVDVPAVWRMNVSIGRFLPDDGFDNARPYAVLGMKMYEELFGHENPLGARIRVGTDRYRVIGVMERKGQMLGFDLDDTLFLPIAKVTELFNRDGLMEIDVAFREGVSSSYVSAQIKRLLKGRHGQEDFTIVTQDKMLDVLGSILTILTAGVAALGAISLVVGAVGIATIMTIAVTERTSEIGLLRAIGAERGVISRVFLIEAMALAAIGGVFGLLIALALTQVIILVRPEFPLLIAWRYVSAALALSVAIGLLAGIAPARRAARVHPIDSLRAE